MSMCGCFLVCQGNQRSFFKGQGLNIDVIATLQNVLKHQHFIAADSIAFVQSH